MVTTRYLVTSGLLALILGLGANHNAFAQRHELSPPPPTVGLPGGGDDVNIRLFELRDACRSGDRNACVRFGIILGEHREQLAEWRRDHPELFFYEEEDQRR